MLWTEKYRPKTLNNIYGQPAIVKTLQAFAQIPIEDIPAMIFIGPPGVGKTTAAHAFANDLHLEYREFNASVDRSVEFIRGELTRLSKVLSPSKRKVVFMDEFDNVLYEGQFALRRIIEENYQTTIFIFSVNYSNKVISPIMDRCVEMFFNPLQKQDYYDIAHMIEQSEGVKFNFDIDEVITLSKDARKFIENLFVRQVGGMLAPQQFHLAQYLDFIKQSPTPEMLDQYPLKVSSQDFIVQVLTHLSKLNKNDQLTDTILKIGDYLLYNPNMDEYAMKLVVSLRLWKIKELL